MPLVVIIITALLLFTPSVMVYTAAPYTPYEPPQAVLSVIQTEEEVCPTIFSYGCSCILGLVERGFSIEGNDAKDLQVNAHEGFVGDIILFKYWNGEEWIYHAGEIVIKYPSGNMEIYECNYTAGVCGERLVMKDDPAIRGYIHKHL